MNGGFSEGQSKVHAMYITPSSLTYNEAIDEFSLKFLETRVAVSIFHHCLEEGFIRARCESIQRPNDVAPVKGSLDGLVDLDGNIRPRAWDLISLDAPANDMKTGSFSLRDPWKDCSIAKIFGVSYNRADIANIVSRKGVGGAPFKKIHWHRMTSILFDLALKDELGQFGSYPEFLTYLEEGINDPGDALGRSALGIPAKQFWAQYKRLKPEP